MWLDEAEVSSCLLWGDAILVALKLAGAPHAVRSLRCRDGPQERDR